MDQMIELRFHGMDVVKMSLNGIKIGQGKHDTQIIATTTLNRNQHTHKCQSMKNIQQKM
jgi:hypothetical protein